MMQEILEVKKSWREFKYEVGKWVLDHWLIFMVTVTVIVALAFLCNGGECATQ